MADVDGKSLLIADIPGLIEGASQGKGLGDEFLRHVERTAVILHMIDVMSNDISGDYRKIRSELTQYSADLAGKPEIIAITKTDLVDDEIATMQLDELRRVTESPIYLLSSQAHHGTKELLRKLAVVVADERQAQAEQAATEAEALDDTPEVIELSKKQLNSTWWVTREERESGTVYVVTGDRIEKFAEKTDFDNTFGVNRLRDILQRSGIARELEHQGANGESIIEIAGHQFTLLEQWND